MGRVKSNIVYYILKHLVCVDIKYRDELFSKLELNYINPPRDTLCSICYDRLKKPVSLKCNHVFCYSCINRWWGTNNICPNCRQVLIFKSIVK